MHTKEPWFYGGTEVSTKEDLISIFSESIDSHVGELGQYFMEVYTEDGKRIAFIAGPTAHDNALRVSVCVNACAGIPTDDLESSPNMGLFHLAEFANETVIQRDELLAALKPFANMAKHFPQSPKYGNRPYTGAIMSMNPGGDDEASITVEDLHAAKAAIAKCES